MSASTSICGCARRIFGSCKQNPPKKDRCRTASATLWRRIHICTRMRIRHAGLRRMPTNAKKLLVQCSSYKQTSKCSAGYSLTARMNVRPHQYDGEHIFLWSTNSRWIAFACSPNIHRISEWRQILFAYTSTLCVSHAFSRSFCIRIQTWMRLNVNKTSMTDAGLSQLPLSNC